MKQEIPQDVSRGRLRKAYTGFTKEAWTDGALDVLIEAAQLPIAPATEEEVARMQGDFYVLNTGGCLSKHETRTVLNQFISRRTPPPQLPPQVDALVEPTMAFINKARELKLSDAELAKGFVTIAREALDSVRSVKNG